MKQEELLLKDLYARLPYGVWIESKLKSCKFSAKSMLHAYDIYAIERGQYDFYKPYLFPLSSMTEEQKVIYGDLCYAVIRSLARDTQAALNELYDWLNKNHFDYRGLIPLELANDATGLNIY